jgi:S-adenosylmethionine decarboxylase
MPSDASTLDLESPSPASSPKAFLLRAAIWNLALFGAIRISWFDDHVIGRLIDFQKTLLLWYGATPHPGVAVNSSCSGADVMALCAGVLLAYPGTWRRRILGAALGVGFVLALNAIRIASLYAVADSRPTLDLLHVYVWPAGLTLATLAYVFVWIRSGEPTGSGVDRRWVRFGVAAVAALAVHAAVAPWVLTSPLVLHVGAWTASTAAGLLSSLGAPVTASGSFLVTSRGTFQVTQECLFTPAIPLYFAALVGLPLSGRQRGIAIALALPAFFVLGIARLLALALPAHMLSSPLIVTHGFYQLVAGAAIIIGASHLAARGGTAARASGRTAAALLAAVVAGSLAGRVWDPLLLTAATVVQAVIPATVTMLVSDGDPQGALLLLPAYQIGLVAGLCVALTGGRRPGAAAVAFGILGALQLLLLVVLGLWTHTSGLGVHALVIRAIAIGLPVVLAMVLTRVDGTVLGDPTYQRFWNDVGDNFPTLTGAASTTYYFENECRLIREALPNLDGCSLLKTDLWDEAKNTRILQWAADQGAKVYGIDLSEPIVRQARAGFDRQALRPVVSDVRRLPFADNSFDAIYSMGTIEHFEETEASVAELARILRPGGRLILGVPNRHDPFLRPVMVAVLSRLGLYGYGYEKCYSRRALRRMIENAGLEVRLESGILFMPGWLRMIDLWCFTRMRPLAGVTGLFVQPFVWLDRRFASLRRHGYLLASVGEKPGADAPGPAPQEVQWQMGDPAPAGALTHGGTEHVVDAAGCDPEALRSLPRLQRLFAEIHQDLDLRPVAPPVWHVFPGEGGITGLVLLSESHLTIHTYPENGRAAINLYCCRPSVEWTWEPRLGDLLGARRVDVRILRRG